MATFRHNFPDAHALNLDLSRHAPIHVMAQLGVEPGQLAMLAGGPPCQGFSKNVPRKFRCLNDTNNLRVHTFLEYCELLEPRLILMENVAEMKNGFSQRYSHEVMERLDKAGYTVSVAVLNAAEYGIPQRRRRAFFLAVKGAAAVEAPRPTHRKDSPDRWSYDQRSFVTVWDAIGDLPSLDHGEGTDPCEYACGPFSDYQQIMHARAARVRNHIARRLRPTSFARLAALQPGQGHNDLPEELKVRATYSGAYGRLTKDMVAPTITRWVFHPGSGRWGHPVDMRTLTIREAARIQGFADNYEFVGTFVQQAVQIGNAVPPLLSERIGHSLRQHLVPQE